MVNVNKFDDECIVQFLTTQPPLNVFYILIDRLFPQLSGLF